MLNCRQASHLVSRKLDGHLNWHDRIELGFHLAICKVCRSYARDIRNLHMLVRRVGKKTGNLLPESVKLSGEARERIRQSLCKEWD